MTFGLDVVFKIAGFPLRHPKIAAFAMLLQLANCGLHSLAQTSRPAPGTATFSFDVAAGANVTPATWADALLRALGDPDSAENVRAVMAWERAEGGHWANAAQFNPLNTTQPEAGSWPINSVGVQAYSSWSGGLRATVETLTNGRYGGILAALREGSCASCVASAVAASPWGTGAFAV